MILTLSVHGLDRLTVALAEIAARPGLDDALRRAAETVRRHAAEALADGRPPESRSGALAASIAVWPGAAPLDYRIGTALAPGWHLEFGTVRRPALPWLEPAFEVARPEAAAQMTDWLRHRVDRTAARAGRQP